MNIVEIIIIAFIVVTLSWLATSTKKECPKECFVVTFKDQGKKVAAIYVNDGTTNIPMFWPGFSGDSTVTITKEKP